MPEPAPTGACTVRDATEPAGAGDAPAGSMLWSVRLGPGYRLVALVVQLLTGVLPASRLAMKLNTLLCAS